MGLSGEEKAPRVLVHPEPGSQRLIGTVDMKGSAYPAHLSTEERPCACYEGLLFLAHLVEEEGEEVEAVETVPCRRCAAHSR